VESELLDEQLYDVEAELLRQLTLAMVENS
jgi:hypothetical protein